MGRKNGTLDLITYFTNEFGSLSKASSLLGFGSTYLSDLKQRLLNPKVKGYNPNYKFSLKNLKKFKENLVENLGKRANYCLFLLDQYIKNNNNLKFYSNQQYRSTLKFNFFKEINTLDKAYWLGFLYADGEVKLYYKGKPWYRISLELSNKDRDHLENFCRVIGLNPSELIKERYRIKKYEDKMVKYHMVYVRFRCKPMAKNLINIGFSSSKSLRKSIPNVFDDSNIDNSDCLLNRKLLLTWLLGYYDGDGISNSTRITLSSKTFLKEIKSKFKIKHQVLLQYEKGKKSRLEGVKSARSHWSLTLGASLFNEMIQIYQNSMPRKRRIFKERDMEIYERLKKSAVNRENLQHLVD